MFHIANKEDKAFMEQIMEIRVPTRKSLNVKNEDCIAFVCTIAYDSIRKKGSGFHGKIIESLCAN